MNDLSGFYVMKSVLPKSEDYNVADKKSMMNFMLIIVALLLIDFIGGYVIVKKFVIPKSYEVPTLQNGNADTNRSEDGSAEATSPGLPFELEPINLNPANSDGDIFSCQFTLEADEPAVIEELNQRIPQIKDIILNYLAVKTIPELSDVAQREEYRKELIQRINAVLMSGKIKNMYITQWILQMG